MLFPMFFTASDFSGCKKIDGVGWIFRQKRNTRKSKTDGFSKGISFSKCMIFQVKHVELQEGVGIEKMGGNTG